MILNELCALARANTRLHTHTQRAHKQELESFTTAVVVKEHMNEVDIKAEQSKLQAQMERRKKQRLARRKKEKATVTTEDGTGEFYGDTERERWKERV